MGTIFSEEPLNQCTGYLQLNIGEFFTQQGQHYCSYCVANGCVNLKQITKLNSFKNVQCECRNKQNHLCLQMYVCKLHEGCDTCVKTLKPCEHCKVSISANKMYCDGCSAILNQCVYCGN